MIESRGYESGMYRLLTDAIATLQPWFRPEQPGQLIGPHVINTGNGTMWADRWPEPRALLIESAGNYALVGQPDAINPAALAPLVVGFVDAAESFALLLHETFPDLRIWDRVVYVLDDHQRGRPPHNALIRRLLADDTEHVAQLSPELAWIANTWGGPAGLAGSDYAWGAFVHTQLAAVACSFFVGSLYEEVGVVTEAAYRGQGLSVACADALCRDIERRG